mmetsp:Transcript_82877/g.268579  ORF Transcript_82877/g.268579 Transcript_82877/m.268579 type:complete len:346 (-) Transcript_82877:718-1755(-)
MPLCGLISACLLGIGGPRRPSQEAAPRLLDLQPQLRGGVAELRGETLRDAPPLLLEFLPQLLQLELPLLDHSLELALKLTLQELFHVEAVRLHEALDRAAKLTLQAHLHRLDLSAQALHFGTQLVHLPPQVLQQPPLQPHLSRVHRLNTQSFFEVVPQRVRLEGGRAGRCRALQLVRRLVWRRLPAKGSSGAVGVQLLRRRRGGLHLRPKSADELLNGAARLGHMRLQLRLVVRTQATHEPLAGVAGLARLLDLSGAAVELLPQLPHLILEPLGRGLRPRALYLELCAQLGPELVGQALDVALPALVALLGFPHVLVGEPLQVRRSRLDVLFQRCTDALRGLPGS